MKIFDWVHRRKPTSMEYRRVPHHTKDRYVGEGSCEDQGEKQPEQEKEALLMNLHYVTSIQHVLDGILTIGTLGYLDYQCQKEFLDVDSNAYRVEGTEPEEEKEEVEQVLELTASAARPNRNLATESLTKEMLETLDINNGNNIDNMAEQEGDILEPLLQEIKANRRERITLADLFLASDDNLAGKAEPAGQVFASAPARVEPEKNPNAAIDAAATGESLTSRAKHGGTLTRKLSSRKKSGEDSPPPTKKIHRMIKKMMKKKIHPEMARDMNASVPGAHACSRDESIDESASLL